MRRASYVEVVGHRTVVWYQTITRGLNLRLAKTSASRRQLLLLLRVRVAKLIIYTRAMELYNATGAISPKPSAVLARCNDPQLTDATQALSYFKGILCGHRLLMAVSFATLIIS